MSKEPIREFNGRIMGWLETDNNGNQILREFSGKILGKYDKASNTTRDFYGRIVAWGNALGILFKDVK